MHVKNKERITFVENISRKRMFAVGIYVRTSRSCEHSGESSISRISWRCRRQPASLPPIEVGVLRARRARVTYEFKGFRETPVRRGRARARTRARGRGEQRTGRLLSSSTAWGRMKTSRASWQLKVCHFSLLLRTFTLPPASLARYLPRTLLHFVPPPSSSRDLLCFLRFSPSPSRAAGGPILARGRSAKCSLGKMDKDQANREGNAEGLPAREREGRRNPTGWNNRLRLRAH